MAERTLIVSGDLHGRFWTGLRTPSGRRVAELTIPSVASTPFAEAVRRQAPVPAGVLARWLRWLNPELRSMNLTDHGAAMLDVTAERLAVEVVDPDGATTFRAQLTRD